MITILIVDDEKLERRGIRFLLKREGDFRFRSGEWKGCTWYTGFESCRYFIFGCKDALHERTGTDKSSKRRSSGDGNRDFQRI